MSDSLVHAAPCKRCPSAHWPPDPESEDCRAAPKDMRVAEMLFVCAWRPSKVCKGLCDFMDVSEADIAQQVANHPDSPTAQMVERMRNRGDIRTICHRCHKPDARDGARLCEACFLEEVKGSSK